LSYWKEFDVENLDLLNMINNATNATPAMETGMNGPMDYWLNVYNMK